MIMAEILITIILNYIEILLIKHDYSLIDLLNHQNII